MRAAGLEKDTNHLSGYACGRVFPTGWHNLLQERKLSCWVNVNGVSLLLAYQDSGASNLLYAELAICEIGKHP